MLKKAGRVSEFSIKYNNKYIVLSVFTYPTYLIKNFVMKHKKIEGIIYFARNIITNQCYIGASTSSLEKRKSDHIQKALNGSNLCFHKALAIYTSQKFEWKVIDTAETIEELARMEREYIKIYDSFKNGYNADSGGSFQKPVYEYRIKEGSLINSYYSLDSAANAVNATKKQLSIACLKENYKVKGSFWSYSYKEPHEAKKDRRKKAVIQLDIENNIINVFYSVVQAASVTGVFKSNIAKVCRNERNVAGGYKWKFVNLKNKENGYKK